MPIPPSTMTSSGPTRCPVISARCCPSTRRVCSSTLLRRAALAKCASISSKWSTPCSLGPRTTAIRIAFTRRSDKSTQFLHTLFNRSVEVDIRHHNRSEYVVSLETRLLFTQGSILSLHLFSQKGS
uniref:(northern house mosquito) hypothetical protein n=1 Tax=Culex pipiens TaxID=7175 RepID=A0A8D8DV42_CULPI